MSFFNILRKSKSSYDELLLDIVNCLGKSLKDDELRNFIAKYKIVCEDKYNMGLFSCSNDFLKFQNKDQRRQLIEEFHITRNKTWMPYNLDFDDNLQDVIKKIGQPDLFDFNFNVYWYYDKRILISFENLQDMGSYIMKITFADNLKNKPSEVDLNQWRTDTLKALSKPESKAFGYNSKWLTIKSSDIIAVLRKFNVNEEDKTSWPDGFKSSRLSDGGIFVVKVSEDMILVFGWALPPIERYSKFYTELSIEFGEIYYFENDSKTPFAWANVKDGLVKRAFKEEYFKTLIDIGEETDIEKILRLKTERQRLLEMEEEYSSDQDFRKEYRVFMSNVTLEIADSWILNPLKLDEKELPDKVFVNRNYRQQK
jgi:hypothetical protein